MRSRCSINSKGSVLDVRLAVTLIFISHHVKKRKLHLHDGSDDGSGSGTYSSQQQALVLISVSLILYHAL